VPSSSFLSNKRDIAHFDAEDARYIRNRLRNTENMLFEKLWRKLVSHIVIRARRSWEMEYYVPPFVPGLPRYNNVFIARRMRVRLRNRGFEVPSYPGENDSPVMFISWRKKKRSKDPKPALNTIRATEKMAKQLEINKKCGYA